MLGLTAVLALLACGDDGGARRDIDSGPIDGGSADAGPACTTAADCDDGVHCNGIESCGAAGCVAGTAIECDDGDPCTIDTCSEADRACAHGGSDGDGDGHDAAGCGDGDDCDDSDPGRHPGADEVCDDDDEDCDPVTVGGTDEDGDGDVSGACCNDTECGPDCDDARSGIHLGATEACNALDDDCDSRVDEGATVTLYPDADGDLHGARVGAMMLCADTPGYVPSNDDCDDGENTVFPGATERCNMDDDDCDGSIDEGLLRMLYRDADGDRYGATTGGMLACPALGLVEDNTDCDDTMAAVNPSARELCSPANEDCSADGNGYTGWECPGAGTRPCVACDLPGGTQACGATTCTYGACTPPASSSSLMWGATHSALGHVCGGACDAETHWCSDMGTPCTAGGMMQYGPYVSLPAGRYEARFEGYCLGGPCVADFDAYDFSNDRIAGLRSGVRLTDTGTTWSVTFDYDLARAVSEGCRSVELRVRYVSGPRNIIYQTSTRRIP